MIPFATVDGPGRDPRRHPRRQYRGPDAQARRQRLCARAAQGLQWWKWKRDPLTIDAVVMYAQRGHGKRSSYYSDYTFGLWREDGELVPVGKAYSGFTDAELLKLDRWIRNHTTEPLRPGAGGGARPGAGDRVRRGAAQQPAQIRRGPAFSPRGTAAPGQAAGGGGPARDVDAADRKPSRGYARGSRIRPSTPTPTVMPPHSASSIEIGIATNSRGVSPRPSSKPVWLAAI